MGAIDHETHCAVTIDYLHWLVHQGKLHSVDAEITGVAALTGCSFLVDIPTGTMLHYSASYWSKFGGILRSSYNPTVTSVGTEITPTNCKTSLASTLLSKFYHTATATHGVGLRPIGIPGGTSIAGTGTSGNTALRNELELKPGRWLVTINPFADNAVIIINASVYEEYE